VTQCPGLTHARTGAVTCRGEESKSPRRNTAAMWETPSKQINGTGRPRGPSRRWGGEQTNLWSTAAPGESSHDDYGLHGALRCDSRRRPPPSRQ